jgi:hypothetical protein
MMLGFRKADTAGKLTVFLSFGKLCDRMELQVDFKKGKLKRFEWKF